jgi:hypothetical protein
MSRESTSPFGILGLPAGPGLTDDEVRAAWRRIAAATHPDRADGGDPARFAEAAAAYTVLRTRFGRTECLADLTGPPSQRPPGQPGSRRVAAWLRAQPVRPVLARAHAVRRPGRLALRLAAATAACAAVAIIAGTRPATPALITGVLTWLLLTGRHDLS